LQPPEGDAAAQVATESALSVLPSESSGPGLELSAAEARLPVELEVAIPLREFRVRRLLALEPGQLVESQWVHGGDVPLAAGDVQLAWSEFEVIDAQLAVRITRLP
jgi:flagellar motor switch/type III secretory pathway protein FliN